MRILILSLFTLSIMACSQKKNITSEVTPNQVETAANDIQSKVIYNNDCYSDRAVTKKINEQEATMVFLMDMYMLEFENTRLQPCAVPEEFHVEGMKVKVSGEKLEIRPNERRAGTPFNITALKKM